MLLYKISIVCSINFLHRILLLLKNMKMKKYLFLLPTLLSVLACNNQKTSNNESDAKDSTNVVASESIEEEKIPENFKIIANYSETNNNYNSKLETYDYTIEITCKDDGSAHIKTTTVTTKNWLQEENKEIREWAGEAAEVDDDTVLVDDREYDGSWKTIEVKRGTKYLTGYDVEASSFEFYFTSNFDLLFGASTTNQYYSRILVPLDNAYYLFYEGKTSYAWKISSFEKL